jgi:hypothetical protein
MALSNRFVSMLTSPAVVATMGSAVVLGLPLLESVLVSSTVATGILKAANVTAFALNCAAVSVPGRIDGLPDEEMRRGNMNPTPQDNEAPPLPEPLVHDDTNSSVYTVARTRTLLRPAGWAFSVWAPIYLGEAIFCTAQLVLSDTSALVSILPQVTAPFVAANICQSLWCASFRPSYNESGCYGWHKYSVAMLAGTAYALSHVQAVAISSEAAAAHWYFLPLTIHFGWATAATLVNLNGSLAQDSAVTNATVIAVGKMSAVAAAALGVGVTVLQSTPFYGLTVAWALLACASQISQKIAQNSQQDDDMQKAAAVQKMLCGLGSTTCLAVSLFTIVV